jgi:hypothetical protein
LVAADEHEALGAFHGAKAAHDGGGGEVVKHDVGLRLQLLE